MHLIIQVLILFLKQPR